MSIDTADWTQTVTLTDTTGAPTSAGAPLANNFFGYNLNFGTSHTYNAGPSDGHVHDLIAAHVWLTCTAGTITGVAFIQVSVVQVSGSTTYLTGSQFFNALPTAGTFPVAEASMAWPGGVTIATQLAGTFQLELICSVGGFAGGTITTPTIQGYAELAWT